MTQLQFDPEAAARLTAVYVTPDVIAQRARLLEVMGLGAGDRVLDVGCGAGFLSLELAERVGASGRVLGVDVSRVQLELAAARCASRSWVTFREADAMHLPCGAGELDVVVSAQVLEYVVDVDQALRELARVVRPGGRVYVLDTDWASLVWHSSDPARMQRVIDAWDEHLSDPHLPRTLAPRLRDAGFEVELETMIPLFNPAFEPDCYSNRLIDLIVAFVVGRRGVSSGEAAAWAGDLRALGNAGRYFFSLNRYLFGARKP
jgi:SAM-dependent methyltransferase